MCNKYLIVIDVQNDFVDGPLGSPEAKAIIPRVKQKIAEYKANGGKIIFTRDTHQPYYLDTAEGRHLPIKHCIEGTHGWQIYEGLADDDSVIIDKHTFGYLDWYNKGYVDADEGTEIEIIGLCTDICVVANALILKTICHENVIKVDSSACAGVTPVSHEAALNTMRMCQVEVT